MANSNTKSGCQRRCDIHRHTINACYQTDFLRKPLFDERGHEDVAECDAAPYECCAREQ